MRVAVFSTKPYDREYLSAANLSHNHDLTFYEPRLTPQTVPLAEDSRPFARSSTTCSTRRC